MGTGRAEDSPGLAEKPWWFIKGPIPEKCGFQYPPFSARIKKMKGKIILLTVLFLFPSLLIFPDSLSDIRSDGIFGKICGGIQLCFLGSISFFIAMIVLISVNGKRATRIGFSKNSLRVHKVKYYYHRIGPGHLLRIFTYGPFRSLFDPEDWIDIDYKDIVSIKRIKYFGPQLLITTKDHSFRIEDGMYERFPGYYQKYLAVDHGHFKDVPWK